MKDKGFYVNMIIMRIDELKKAIMKESRPTMQVHLQDLLKTNRAWLQYITNMK